MVDTGFDPLRQILLERLGVNMGEDAVSPDGVNMPMIRHWVDAFGCQNPIFEDEEVAGKSRFKGVIAPFTMLPAWTMHRPQIEGILERGGFATEPSKETPLRPLESAGFNLAITTGYELHIERPLRPGESVRSETTFQSISTRKETGLGKGYFIATRTNCFDGSGSMVGWYELTVFIYDPKKSEPAQ